jgi:ERF superfamily protein
VSEHPTFEAQTALYAALAKAQGEIKDPKKNRELKVQGRAPSMYADLASVAQAVRAAWAPNGLSFSQDVATTFENGIAYVSVWTTIFHADGASLRSEPLVIPVASNAQAIGSGETYGRRYQLQALAGIAADDDDDATLTSDGHGGSSESSSGGKDRGSTGKGEAVQPPLDAPKGRYRLAANKCPHTSGIDTAGRCVDCGKPLEVPITPAAEVDDPIYQGLREDA